MRGRGRRPQSGGGNHGGRGGPGGHHRPHRGDDAYADIGAAAAERFPRYVPPPAPPRPAELVPTDRTYRDLKLYPFQAEAVDAITAGHSVLVAAPTGSGKTLVADYAIDRAFEEGWRVVYTSPIKALSNQKYRDFRARHGDDVGILTGDVTLRPDAPLLVMTTEVFRNTLFDEPGRLADFRFVIHDEVHYIDDVERGTVWEESIIHAPPQMRLVCLSATVPNVREIAEWIGTVRGEPVTVVEMTSRPVPLDHMVWFAERGPLDVKDGTHLLDEPLRVRKRMRRERNPHRLLDWIVRERLLPVLVFCFRRVECENLAWEARRRRLLTDEESARMADLFDDLARRYELPDTPAVRQLRELALRGVAWHHAGALPVMKEVVERLFTSGLLKMLFATETFALGVNMPARTVAFSALRKFDGERMDYMLCREYGQMAGRAGRQGMDSHGLVVSMLDPIQDRSSGVRRVLTGQPEAVVSRWNPDYATLLSLYEHLGDRVLETYEKSLARFQRERRKGGRERAAARETSGARAPRSEEERTMEARLRVLRRAGYIEEGKLSEKGRFASRINGYEIHAAEWTFGGHLDGLDPVTLGSFLLAAAFQPRTDDPPSPCRDAELRRQRGEANDAILRWREEEWHAGLATLTKGPEFHLSGALAAWCAGLPLADCAKRSPVGEGDLVRWFRLMLQYARQIRKALPRERTDLARRLQELIRAVDRDEVDAARQMELGEEDAVPPAPLSTTLTATPPEPAPTIAPTVPPTFAPTIPPAAPPAIAPTPATLAETPPARHTAPPSPPPSAPRPRPAQVPEENDFGEGL